MTLQNIKVGDIVRCDVNGRVFYAVVEEKVDRALVVQSISPNVNYRQVKSAQVKNHWRKSKAS